MIVEHFSDSLVYPPSKQHLCDEAFCKHRTFATYYTLVFIELIRSNYVLHLFNVRLFRGWEFH